jgi:fatty-acyl-CoA synthase
VQPPVIVRAKSAYDYPLLLKQLLHTPLALAPRQEIVYRDQRRYDYVELRRRIGRLASALAGLGIGPGDTVAVMDWDSHRYLEAYFAVPMMGATLMTVNFRLSEEQLAYTLAHSQAKALLVNTELLPLLVPLRDKLASIRVWVALSDGAAIDVGWPGFAGEYEELLAGSPADFDFPDFDENARATQFYTTGTTGTPKGVSFSHRQLVLQALAVMAAAASSGASQSFTRRDVYMPLTPMFHVHAWGNPYIATMMGSKQVYPGRYVPEALLELVAREGVTFSHCVPAILHAILTCPAARNADLRGWKVVIGGSALTTELASAALRRGIDVFAGYGMSETCPTITVAHTDRASDGTPDDVSARCLAGQQVPLVELRVVDEQMRDLPRDGKSVGEIVARAPWFTQGYVGDPEASERLWAGGWLHTQDIGSLDEAGRLRISDRIKDVIKSGGEWISSVGLEQLLAEHAAVSEVAVIGVPEPRWGERPVALVVPKPGADVTEGQLRQHLLERVESGVLARYGVPDRILLVDGIAKTSVGKFDKKRLRAQYEGVLTR